MGLTSSEFDRDLESQASWIVEHGGLGSPWSQFALRRYGSGFGATGVALSVALPRLMRRRLQDWSVQGLGVHIGHNFVSFGRQLESLSRGDAQLFFGIDIFFGDNTERSSWFWYCRTHEWLLQLHKAVLEPLPPAPPSAAPMTSDTRWPGTPRLLGEDPAASRAAREKAAAQQAARGSGGGQSGGNEQTAAEVESALPEGSVVDHQLSLFLSNADGHVGLLCLPIPQKQVQAAAAAVAKWSETCEVPLEWAGRRWETKQDFNVLRESALNMPDVLLLGLETELAMALTPDWTWEKYPRGFGEAALPRSDEEEEVTADGAAAERGDVGGGGDPSGGASSRAGGGNHESYDGAAGLGLPPRQVVAAS